MITMSLMLDSQRLVVRVVEHNKQGPLPELVGCGRISISVKFGQKWSDSVGFIRICSDLVRFGRSNFWEGT